MTDASARPQDACSPTEPTLPEPKPVSNPKGTSSALPSSPSAGQKRPAPSLLPAFEPLSSSPALPRPLKRQNTGNDSASGSNAARLKYPTPIPTSSTGILSSSPPRRAPFVRTSTTASEREPLSAVPTVDLPENGEVLMMGRSSNTSHYQLSSNRLVSRVHAKARYIPASDGLEPNKIEIICNGWNGLKLHSQGRTWELFKGDSFTSETEGTEIMLDVQDARVMIQWPKRGGDALANLSDSSWDDSPRSHVHAQGNGLPAVGSSPLRRTMRIQSPESPTPGHLASSQRLQALFPGKASREEEPSIQIYEDGPEPELPQGEGPMDVGASMRTEATASFSSDGSGPDSDGEHNPDEENDPLIHSFGPFGANISGRFASISTCSPKAAGSPSKLARSQNISSHTKTSPGKLGVSPRRDIPCEPLVPEKHESPAKSESLTPLKGETPSPPVKAEIDPAITNHVMNQLAFSRLSSTPLPTIMQNLPSDSKVGLTKESLRDAIEATAAIGIIERQGKDAAGKPLESEYYYVPENDDDEQRRAAVVDGLRKPSLRACRKQHKQYYWKRPKTP